MQGTRRAVNLYYYLMILYNRQLMSAKLWKWLCNFPEESKAMKTL